jgi:hypothetical protein
MTSLKLTFFSLCLAVVAGCGDGLAADVELANATGDAMANLDEASIGSSLALQELPIRQTPDFLKPSLKRRVWDALFPSAYADSCWTEPFTACASGGETRTFSGCNIGLDTIDGTVTLAFSDPSCSMLAATDSVTRTGDFTVTGFEGGTLTVTSPGGGQELTNNGNLAYQVLGMERVATGPDGKELFDISSSTTSDLGVTGLTRATRVVNGGTLVIQHNLLNYSAALSPQHLAWSTTCNCPVSGSWTGTLSGSRTGSYTLEITGCGTAALTVGDASESIILDRCGAL